MARTGAGHKGYFITFEGPEGSGKTTHAKGLFDFLKRKGYDCIFTREPGGTAIGDKIREILLERKSANINKVSELLLFEANRAQIVEEVILPALKKGRIAICDRFTDATMAYQGYGAGLDKKLIEKLNHAAGQGLQPDLTILLDIKPEKGLKRALKHRKADRMEFKSIGYHRRVRNGYLALARRYPKRIKVVDADRSVQKAQADINRIVEKCLLAQ